VTNADILNFVRHLIQDAKPPYRHSDDKLLAFLTDAVAVTRRLRPDLSFGELQDDLPIYRGSEGLAATPPIDPAYHHLLGHYVVALVQASEDESAHLERLNALLVQFNRMLVG
jgi:hypothetical protein